MNRKKWNSKDISAYLDNELEPKRRAVFERDIAADPDLRRRVDDMQQVVSMVRAAPLRETPRNYLLTPSMVAEAEPQPQPKRRRVPLFGLRLATSFVALAFVVTFGLALLQQGLTPAGVLQSDGAADAPVMMQSEEVEQSEAPAAEPPASMKSQEIEVTREVEAGDAKDELTPDEEQAFAPVPESASEEGEGGIGGGEVPPGTGGGAPADEEEREPTAETMAMEMEDTPIPPEEEEALEVDEDIAPTGAAPNSRTAPGDGTPLAEMAPTEELAAAEQAADAGDDSATVLPQPTVVTPETPELQEQQPVRENTQLLWLSLGLGIATVVLTIMTFWMARRRS